MIISEISDDTFLISHPKRLVSIAALQALLTLTSPLYSDCSVTFLLSLLVANHSLLIIRFCYVKIVNSKRLCSGGPNRWPSQFARIPNRTLPKIDLFNQGRLFSLCDVALVLFKQNIVSPLTKIFTFFVPSSTRPYLTTFITASPRFLSVTRIILISHCSISYR